MQTISETEKSVQRLSGYHGWWNTWSVRFIAATVVVTALYFFAQWMTNKHGSELAKAQEDLIRMKDDQLSENLKAKDVLIAEANNQAGIANARAKDLENKNVQLRTDLENATADAQAKIEAARAEADTKIEQARTEAARQVGEVQKDVAKQQERAANAERALIEVQERVKPRRPTKAQQDALIAFLSKNPIKGKVDMFFQQGDPEAYNFALELLQILRENDWGPFESMNPQPTANAYGEVRMFAADRSTVEFQTLYNGLVQSGFPMGGKTDPSLPAGKIVIVVGTELRQPIRVKPQ